MTQAEHQDIVLYPPKWGPYQVVFSLMCLFLGVALPLFSKGGFLPLIISLLFILGGLWIGPVMLWKRLYHPRPLLIINAEGISRNLFGENQLLKWDEIESIYRINTSNGGVFGVDITPAGVIAIYTRRGKPLPSGKAIRQLQEALGIPAVNLPIPVDDLLTRIHEQFSEQLERYHIECQRG